ncbi:DoxX family protein [Roseicyclus persicicus]|uniref:DoxX family protein n=1 Tax=Roseicyclus persicicus TaxID=2650661 RepID=A0A7X6GXF0_9RHOB|nr:DoxX family protein [Roseibacterium persicicum]NKX44088.1 DoxX family protein [Roseibacterium persicicum]
MSTLTTNDTARALTLPGASAAHWLVRASLAGTFLFHGITKFPYLAAGAEMMGLPFWLWTLVAVVETGAGLAILLGGALRTRLGDLLTRAAGLGVIAIMIGAIWMVHWGQWSNIPSETHPFGGMEFQTLLLALGAYFTLRGNDA